MNRTLWLRGLLAVSCFAGCTDGGASASDGTDAAATPSTDTAAELDGAVDADVPLDAEDADGVSAPDAVPDSAGEPERDAVADVAPDGAVDPGPLRPNVQEGEAPNADDQTPAFDEQTRAPQPAQPTAFTTTVLATGLEVPWGIAPMPDGRLLVTERAGRLRIVDADGAVSAPIQGVPTVAVVGQGGLLDVAIGPDFASDRSVFLTFTEDRGGGTYAPAVARGTLSADGSRLEDLTVLYQQSPPRSEGRHFGTRLVFDRDGNLFVTFGDRGSSFEDAQSPFNGIGAVIRIRQDGSIPSDNPFVDGVDGDPAVWSWGHRNIQSATLDADGRLWTVEHGARGGDELNQPQAGLNYGWPIITYGQDYNGQPVGDGLTALDGMEQPVYFWDPVIAPSGMATYRGSLFEGWDGDLLVGGLQAQALVRLSLRDGRVYTEEWLPMGTRVRCVAIAEDGAVLLGTDAGEIVVVRPG